MEETDVECCSIDVEVRKSSLRKARATHTEVCRATPVTEPTKNATLLSSRRSAY